jgi:serine/threonine-protein kinase
MALEAGHTLDRYTIEALVGEGGMGHVYRAFDTRLHRCVALKVLRVGPASLEQGIADVLREARAAAAIAHPNATSVFDAGEFEGLSFIAMEYVPGTSLRRLIGAPDVALETRLRWLVDIAGALAAAHQVGVIHRDIKPENVMIRDDGLVKVLDFGVAGRVRVLDDAASDTVRMITPSSGNAVGTPAYMAPEQLRGVAIDARADQFGWAVLAYELLTGRLPWKEADDFMRYLVAVLTEQVQAPRRLDPGIPLDVEAAILRGLAKMPEQRFPTMAAAAATLALYAGPAIAPTVFAPSRSPAAYSDIPASGESDATMDVSAVLAELAPSLAQPPPPVVSRPLSPAPPPVSQPRAVPAPPISRPRSVPPPPISRPVAAPPSSSGRPTPTSSKRPPPISSGRPPPSSPRRPPISSNRPPPSAPGRSSSLPPPSSPRVLSSRPSQPTWIGLTGADLDTTLDTAPRTTFATRVPTLSASGSADAATVGLRLPRLAAPVDLEEHIRRVPPGATVKGMFFVDLQRASEEAGVWPAVLRTAGVAERRYYAFSDYPMVDNLRLTVAAAAHLHPRLPIGDAVRRLGQGALDVVLASQIGRTLFGILGSHVEPFFLRAPKAFKLLVAAGEVTSEKLSERSYRFRARQLPLFLETYQVGVIEGVLRHCGEKGRILIGVEDVANATLVVEIG